MTEEIKEILEFLEDDNRERPFGISKYDLKVLKDYITNLQQENEKLKKEFKPFKKLLSNAIDEANCYKSRCEKALKKLKEIRQSTFTKYNSNE